MALTRSRSNIGNIVHMHDIANEIRRSQHKKCEIHQNNGNKSITRTNKFWHASAQGKTLYIDYNRSQRQVELTFTSEIVLLT